MLWTSIAFAVDTSRGPVSPAEADVLWKDGNAAYQVQKYADAVPYFQRLIDRYPGFAGHLEAHYLIGLSFLKLSQPEKAIAPLKFFVAGEKKARQSSDGRVALGQAFIRSGRFQEAFLTSLELEKFSAFLPHSLILRARAQIGLKQLANASLSLAAVPADQPPAIAAEALEVSHQLKLAQCADFSPQKLATEAETIEGFEKRANCLIEALLLYRQVAHLAETEPCQRALDRNQSAWASFFRAALAPPAPKFADNKTHSSLEIKRFKSELRTHLANKFDAASSQAIEFLHSWAPLEPAEVHPWLKKLEDTIRKHKEELKS